MWMEKVKDSLATEPKDGAKNDNVIRLEYLFITWFYRKLSSDIKIKIIRWFYDFYFNIRGKLSVIRCYIWFFSMTLVGGIRFLNMQIKNYLDVRFLDFCYPFNYCNFLWNAPIFCSLSDD